MSDDSITVFVKTSHKHAWRSLNEAVKLRSIALKINVGCFKLEPTRPTRFKASSHGLTFKIINGSKLFQPFHKSHMYYLDTRHTQELIRYIIRLIIWPYTFRLGKSPQSKPNCTIRANSVKSKKYFFLFTHQYSVIQLNY